MTSLPRRTAARTARLATLPIGYAGRATVGLGRRIGGAPAEAVAAEVQRRTAEQLFKVLGELKGGALKVGQALSVFESALPETVAGPYRAALIGLQDAAPAMPSSTLREVLSTVIGPDWSDALVELDLTPAAAASIGQVHRGRWHDGREVAVKIQYPGAAAALRSDLRQIARVARVVGPLLPGIDMRPLAEELQERLSEELDYAYEAQAQAAFADAFRGDPHLCVPDVVASWPTVLVSEWLESDAGLSSLIGSDDVEARHHHGETYVRFLFSGPARTGLLHADPHPGNFRLLSDGRLGVVDYGAVDRLDGGALPIEIGTLLRAAVDDDYQQVLDGLRDLGFIKPEIRMEVDDLREYLSPFVEPAAVDEFQFSRAWMRRQFARINDPRQPGYATMTKIGLPRDYLLIHRVWLGGIGVLSQLEARARFRDILAESLPGFDA